MAEEIAGGTIRYGLLPPEEVILGTSGTMNEVRYKLERVACTNVPILIRGEAGSGKEVLARLIHRRYPGDTTSFHKVTPAGRDGWRKSSRFVLPRHGTNGDIHDPPEGPGRRACIGSLFFDEVAELNFASQRSLTNLLQDDRSFGMCPAEYVPTLFRVICSTKYDIEQEMSIGNFREDLFYSISILSLHLPPLRARREDIPGLARYFWECYGEEFGSDTREPSFRLMDAFQEHDWPGNIRELANTMKRYVLLGSEEKIVDELTARSRQSSPPKPPSGKGISLKSLARHEAHELERRIILKTLGETRWNRRKAALALNISYRTLLYKIKEAGVSPQVRCREEE